MLYLVTYQIDQYKKTCLKKVNIANLQRLLSDELIQGGKHV